MLIWHVDAAKAGNTQECGPLGGLPACSAAVHYKVALVQADNLWDLELGADRGDTGDPYPGSTSKTSFSSATSPNSNLYAGTASGVSISSISASAATMTATLSAGATTASMNVTLVGSGSVASNPAGIACAGDCTEAFACGTGVTLTATPGGGSAFSAWSGGGCSGAGTCSVTMDQPRAVTATFTTGTYTLTVSKAGTGTGTVTSNPAGISCGADCSEPYGGGTSVVLTAAPDASSTFAGWSGGGCSGTGTCTVPVTAATTVTATFTLRTYALNVSKAGTGTGTVTSNPTGITCGADCTETYNHGTSVTLTAAADASSTFAGWSGGGCSGLATTCSVTLNATRSITATFTGPGGFYAVTPCRVLDTRTIPDGPLAGPVLAAGQTRIFDVDSSPCGIPADAEAISVNVTVTAPTAPGFLTIFGGGQSMPLTSIVNFSKGQTRANNAVVSLASDGSATIQVSNGSAGQVHAILDVNGYFR